MRSPQVVPLPGLPSRVTVYEVGLATGCRTRRPSSRSRSRPSWSAGSWRAGSRAVELTSFVHPRWVPQLADAEQLLAELGSLRTARSPTCGRRCSCRTCAASSGRSPSACTRSRSSSAPPSPSRARTSTARAARRWTCRAEVARGRRRGRASRCAATCPCASATPGRATSTSPRSWTSSGPCATRAATSSRLGDTIGVGHRRARRRPARCLARRRGRRRPARPCTSTTPTARRSRTPWPRCSTASRSVDASAGGLGGCPFAKSATGNLATEDLVWTLTGWASQTGLDLPALVATSVWLSEQMGRPSPSRAVRALG